MRVTTELLKSIGEIKVNSDEIINIIKEGIGNVEYYHNIGKDYEGITVAEIVEKNDHPDADKLGVYKVFTGQERIQVVAGDKTLEIGDKVAYIPPESIVPSSIYTELEPILIKKMKLRGIESNGMLASEKELNIGPKHDHVMRLEMEAIPGTKFVDYYYFNDTVIEIENKGLTNRGDLFGLVGIAREITAITGDKFTSPSWYKNDKKNLKPEINCLNLEITNDAEALCPRYTAIALDSIENSKSPIWLRSALLKLDIKPTNSIVDITNYISAIFGQPLHAFDYDKIITSDPAPDNKVNINIRMAREGEEILALDNKTYRLNDRTIVIADSRHPIAIAGVIGGKDTSVDENTTRIIFESANFDKNSIRRTSMGMGISTDAATKYKHSLDTEVCLPALLRAVELAKEICGAKVASGVIDIYNQPYTETIITLDIKKLNTHIGLDLTKDTIKSILTNLEYRIISSDKTFITVSVPSWRRDILLKEDIHEDIARVFGYKNIPMILPKKEIVAVKENKLFTLKKNLRKTLSDLGLNEILTYSFTSSSNFEKCELSIDSSFKIKNSLSPDLSLMRTTLLQSILVKMKENRQRGFDRFGLFEINIPHINTYLDENTLPKEDWHLSLALNDHSEKQDFTSSYYLGKKYFDKILDTLNLKGEYILIGDSLEQNIPEDIKVLLALFDPNVSALCLIEKKIVGVVGEFKSIIKRNFKLDESSCGLDINLNRILELPVKKIRYREIPKFPSYSADLCFQTNTSIKYDDMYEVIDEIINKNEYWGVVECLDIYQDKKTPDKKKTTFRITGAHYNQTVNDKDIKRIIEKIEKKLDQLFEAKLL